jgi:hypothetical protein
MDLSLSTFLKLTKPGPQEPCPTCETWSLRRYSETGEPENEKVICTNARCSDSPFFERNRRA